MLYCYVNIFEILQEPPKIKKIHKLFFRLTSQSSWTSTLNDLTITDNKTRGKMNAEFKEEFVKKEILVSEIETEFEHEEDEMYINFEAVNDLVREEFIPSNVKEEPKGIDNVSFQAQNKQDLKGIFKETILSVICVSLQQQESQEF